MQRLQRLRRRLSSPLSRSRAEPERLRALRAQRCKWTTSSNGSPHEASLEAAENRRSPRSSGGSTQSRVIFNDVLTLLRTQRQEGQARTTQILNSAPRGEGLANGQIERLRSPQSQRHHGLRRSSLGARERRLSFVSVTDVAEGRDNGSRAPKSSSRASRATFKWSARPTGKGCDDGNGVDDCNNGVIQPKTKR